MTGPRDYSAATRAALAQLSGGNCYRPGCPRPILTFIGGEPYIDYHIAHIRDANRGNRYAPEMTDDERRAFSNLVLLCKPCHDLVDKRHPEDYPRERLEQWKSDREGSSRPALAALGRVDEAYLAALLTSMADGTIGGASIEVVEAGRAVLVRPGGDTHREAERRLVQREVVLEILEAADPTELVEQYALTRKRPRIR